MSYSFVSCEFQWLHLDVFYRFAMKKRLFNFRTELISGACTFNIRRQAFSQRTQVIKLSRLFAFIAILHSLGVKGIYIFDHGMSKTAMNCQPSFNKSNSTSRQSASSLSTNDVSVFVLSVLSFIPN